MMDNKNKSLTRSLANDDKSDDRSMSRIEAWNKETARLGRELTTDERVAIAATLKN